MEELSEKTAIITGAASGIGRALARALARQRVALVLADFDSSRMDRAMDEALRLGSPRAIRLDTDVRSDRSVRALVRDSIKAMAQVDILVNAAGILHRGSHEQVSPAAWSKMLESNLLGAVRTSSTVLPHMVERRSGHIVNIVSFGGLVPGSTPDVAYDTVQAALAAYTACITERARAAGVWVSIFCPGSHGPLVGEGRDARSLDSLASAVVEALHNPRFLATADSGELLVLERRWEPVLANTVA